jgi:hypothetical protein
MHSHSQPGPSATPPRPRRPGCCVAAGVLIASALTLGACGKSATPTDVIILNTEKVERAIEKSSLDQRGTRAQVSCPSGVHQKQGLKFSCTAVVKSDSTRFEVTQLDGAGRVHYEAR